jgi:hypothetical protein
MGRVMVAKTARITVETDTVIIVRQARTAPGWCPVCRAEVDVITLDSASVAEPGSGARLQDWLNTGKLHFWQSPNGPAQICLPSLLHCFELDGLPRMRIAKETT